MSIAEFFESSICNPVTDCWEWTRGRTSRGYGVIRYGGKQTLAHRFSYEYYVGEIPKGKSVLHLCDNPPCVNPEHLVLGTQLDNMRDCMAKGRYVCGERHKHSKLNNDLVLAIRASSGSQRQIAKRFGTSQPTVCEVKTRKRWKHI